MHAVTVSGHSDALDVYTLPTAVPQPAPDVDQVLIRVHYAALNRLDDWVRRGWKGLNLDFPHIPCSDFVGEIAACGAHVHGWRVGEMVTANPLIWCGHCRACLRGEQNRCVQWHLLGEDITGVCADYAVVPARNLARVPDGYDLRKAAAASLVYVTAWHNLIVTGGLTAGEEVLVVGAGGGVNTAAIQIARLAGCRVYVIAGDTRKAEAAAALGADWVHDRSKDPDWGPALYAATDRRGVAMVVDNVGEATWATSLRALSPGGRLVTVGGTSGYGARIPVNLIFAKHLRILGSTMGSQDDYLQVMELIFAGRLDPVVDSVFPMSAYADAMAHMLANRQFGKILIDVIGRE